MRVSAAHAHHVSSSRWGLSRVRLKRHSIPLSVAILLLSLTGCSARAISPTTPAPQTIRVVGYLSPDEFVGGDNGRWYGTVRVFGPRPWSWTQYSLELGADCAVRASSGATFTVSQASGSPDWAVFIGELGQRMTVEGRVSNGGDTILCDSLVHSADATAPEPGLPLPPAGKPSTPFALSGYIEGVKQSELPGQEPNWLVTLATPSEITTDGLSPQTYQVLLVNDATALELNGSSPRSLADTMRLLGSRRFTAAEVKGVVEGQRVRATRLRMATD